MVIRLSNLKDQVTAIELLFAHDVKEVKMTDILENPISATKLASKRSCVMNIGPRKILSIKVEF
jgi:hypothetical protein